MGKGDLWDDSAFINAFDEAIANYKKMHGKGSSNCSAYEGKILKTAGENESPHINENCEAQRLVKTDNNSKVVSKTEEIINLLPVEEIQTVDTCIPQNHRASSNDVQIQSVDEHRPTSQAAQDYNHLLSQYYEIEEQRQRIWQQLNQVGTSNYHCSDEGAATSAQWGAYSTSREYPAPTAQASQPTVTCSSCCHFQSACPYTPVEFSSLDRTCVGKACNGAPAAGDLGKLASFMDGDIIKNAMGAAAEAIFFMEKKTSADSNIDKGQEREGVNGDKNGATGVPETDLTVVLKAWYSAGFYTAKYLMEREAAKKQHG